MPGARRPFRLKQIGELVMARIRITQLKSSIGKTPRQRATLKALGLKRINDQVVQEESPVIDGMLKKIGHLVQVDPVK